MAETVLPLIAGNWKMNGLKASLGEAEKLGGLLDNAALRGEVALCPPATLLAAMSVVLAPLGIVTGGQDCHAEAHGAHTGDVSAEMLKDAGARFVIVGHSERRADHGETDAIVRKKAEAAMRAGLVPIICVGETRAEREAGRQEAVVAEQLAGSVPDGAGEFVIAYEPVWAIGTGLTPTNDDIRAMHGTIRGLLAKRFAGQGEGTRILYGGSLKPGNAGEILAITNVNGGLVGGASLLANDLYAIISAL